MLKLFFYLFFILILNFDLFAVQKDINENLISVIKITQAKVRDRKISNDKYIVDYYYKGDILDLDYCDKDDWCKVKDEELYMSKSTLGVMLILNDKTNNKVINDQELFSSSDVNITDESMIPFKQINITEIICIKLKQIDLTENNILDKKSQFILFTSYYDECISSKIIKPILSSISKYYIDKGYITTKPYLIEQDISDGQLDIAIAKGLIEDIIDSNTSESNWKIATAFISQKGNILNLRDLETSLEVINRVPSIDAKFEITPGKQQGSSIINISEKKSLPWHIQIGGSDEGSINNGEPYLTANISYDNLFNINDVLSFRLNGTSVQKEYQGTKAGELNYTFPIGSYFFEAVYFKYTYDREVYGQNDTYISTGDTDGGTFKINKILFRNQKNKLKATLSIQHKDTKNYFSQALVEVSSYKTTLAQVDLSHTLMQSWGQLISTYSFYRGTDWFGARDDSYFDDEIDHTSDAKLEFVKHTLDTSLYYTLENRSYQFTSNLHIQYSNDFLYDNNKLTVGSYYTVRGYLSSLYGNTGMYIHNDFTKTFRPNISTTLLQTFSTFVGLDYGYVDCQEDNPNSCGGIAGYSLGAKTAAKYLSSDFSFSRYLVKINELKDEFIMRYNVQITF